MSTVELLEQLLLESGPQWVFWLLGLLSVAGTAVTVERWLFYRSRSGDLEALAEGLHRHLSGGDLPGAVAELERSGAVAARIAAAGLRLADRGPAAADRAMQSAAALEQGRLERWLALLGTLGNNAPFVGLLGTVVGIIGAFEALGRSAPGRGAGQLASQAMMASIAEALVATALGLLVALPAVAANNYYHRRVASLLAGTGALTNLVLAYLAGREPAERG